MSEPAIAIGSSQTGAKEIGHSIIVPINPQSHLMYYLSCVNTLLKPEGTQTDRDMRKLCDYKNYSRLTEQEVDKVLLMCFLLSPDVLLNKCVFVCDDLCKDYDNNFYEISNVSQRFVITRDLLVGGERREVNRIMACRLCWLQENFFSPMEHYKDRLLRVITTGSRQQSRPASAPTPAPRPTENQASPTRPTTSRGTGQPSQPRSWCSIS